jgi:ribosomal protein S18 acetylase RimI-like enzyme
MRCEAVRLASPRGLTIIRHAMTETETIRRATPGDAGAISTLTHRAYAKWLPILGRKPKPMTADYDQAVREHLIDLLFVGNSLAALVETIPAADHLLIENLAVAPDFQGRGYGRRLAMHAEELARSLGHGEIRLYTNKLFAANVALYRRLGYGIDREEPFKGGFLMHMSKRV